MTYYYDLHTKNGRKEMSFRYEEKPHCHPIYIEKEYSFFNSTLFEKAMRDLSPTAFVAYCYVGNRANGCVWVVDVDDLPLKEDAQSAMNELIAKGYLTPVTLSGFIDENGEVADLNCFVFTEKSKRMKEADGGNF
jgi:hypothetical protein